MASKDPTTHGPVEPAQTQGSHDYEVELRALRQQLKAMGDRCRHQLHLALDAFWTGSKDKMADVEAADRTIDRDEKSIDALLLRILALRQPVASDLRMVMASFRLVTDLERIGDESVDLARTPVTAAPDGEEALRRLSRMTESTKGMLDRALSSFFDRDPEAASEMRRSAASIAVLYQEIRDDAIAFIAKDPDDAAAALSWITVAKCLERVADHAANVGEATLFVLGRDERMPR